jgi:hypothetical protein
MEDFEMKTIGNNWIIARTKNWKGIGIDNVPVWGGDVWTVVKLGYVLITYCPTSDKPSTEEGEEE